MLNECRKRSVRCCGRRLRAKIIFSSRRRTRGRRRARSVAGKLIEAGWAREIMAPNGAPVWRKDAASGDGLL